MAFVDLTSGEITRLKAILALDEIATTGFVDQEIFKTQNSPRGAIDFSTATVASNTITPVRKGIVTYVKIATSSASDTVNTVDLTDFSEGDQLIFIQDDSTKPITMEGGTGNILNQIGDFTLTNGTSNAVYFVDSSNPKKLIEGFNYSMVGAATCNIKCVRVDISSAEVLTLNTTPITAVAAPGAGKAIEPISASRYIDFNTTAYATNTDLTLEYTSSGANDEIGQMLSGLAGSTSRIDKFYIEANDAASAAAPIFANEPLLVTCRTGDPTAGDSPIVVNIVYKIITL